MIPTRRARPARLTPLFLLLPLAWLAAACGRPAASGSAGSTAASDSAEAVAGRYMAALGQAHYDTAAHLMHPEARTQIRDLMQLLVSKQGSESFTKQMFGVDSAGFAQLDAEEVTERFLSGLFRAQPGLARVMGTLHGDPVGTVAEGDSVLHVVMRIGMGDTTGLSISKMDVVSLKTSPDGWRVLLSGQIGGVIDALRQRMAPSRS